VAIWDLTAATPPAGSWTDDLTISSVLGLKVCANFNLSLLKEWDTLLYLAGATRSRCCCSCRQTSLQSPWKEPVHKILHVLFILLGNLLLPPTSAHTHQPTHSIVYPQQSSFLLVYLQLPKNTIKLFPTPSCSSSSSSSCSCCAC
jgi:hypothetical protein